MTNASNIIFPDKDNGVWVDEDGKLHDEVDQPEAAQEIASSVDDAT